MPDSSQHQLTKEQWLEIAWSQGPPDLSEETRKLLEEYSRIPPDEVDEHVTKVREKGFKIWPYPCIGQWRFLHLALGRHPLYQTVLSRMLTGKQIFLDLGCAFAQDIRRLVADGVDSSQCYGLDLQLQFLDLGYELFRDKATLQTTFIEGDVFAEDNDNTLCVLYGKVDIINSSSFFHLFSWNDQKRVARQCLQLWAGKPGDLLVGRQVGNLEPGEVVTRRGGKPVYRHNAESWRRFWDEVTAESGVSFKVDADMREIPSSMQHAVQTHGRAEGTRIMIFSVERIV